MYKPMRNIILADLAEVRASLLPLTYTRPIADLQTGLLTTRLRWETMLPGHYSYLTVDYLDPIFPAEFSADADNIIIYGHVMPSPELVQAIESLKPDTALTLPGDTDTIIARRGLPGKQPESFKELDFIPATVTRPFHIFSRLADTIPADFKLVTKGMTSVPLHRSCTLIGDPSHLFIHPTAKVTGCTLNVTDGPIYIGPEAEVMEGATLRGPIAVNDHAHVNMGARIYGPTVLGSYCKVGGELNNVAMHPYSNKAHDGFLGNAVIGSWCNLGAGSTASNLKNDYSEIKLWDYPSRRFLRTGLQFCGLIMGDHSKAGINTMFNTATVVGVGVNIHGTGFPRNFVASFSDGSATTGFRNVSLESFFTIAERVMARRGHQLTDSDRQMFEAIRDIAESYK